MARQPKETYIVKDQAGPSAIALRTDIDGALRVLESRV